MTTSRVFALDTWFYNSLGSYSFEARCEMLSQLGYDGINITLWSEQSWADVPAIAGVRDRYGIDVTGVYTSIEDEQDSAGIRRIHELLESVPAGTIVDLAVLGSAEAATNSDRAGDARIADLLAGILPIAEQRGITISLYHHINTWMERLEDALRLCNTVDHPSLRLTFSTHHWYVTDGRNPRKSLTDTAPRMSSANFCGSRRVPNDTGTDATIELIDQGELDNFHMLGLLKSTGFDGPVGIQGFSMGGDAYAKLRHSITAFRDIEARVDAHPAWFDFRPDPIPSAREEKTV